VPEYGNKLQYKLAYVASQWPEMSTMQ